ncbi:GHKL domain-containing protein [Listeria sp. PSOL-1]|uniref:GHKL domain-containing protein n=1 Tax=Listeria sp. PSOL-1 TaxID=1844999 RepID=UPI0013D00B6E|nr:GHKL domain-containing protein [Listeria sp. PSOL-1]
MDSFDGIFFSSALFINMFILSLFLFKKIRLHKLYFMLLVLLYGCSLFLYSFNSLIYLLYFIILFCFLFERTNNYFINFLIVIVSFNMVSISNFIGFDLLRFLFNINGFESAIIVLILFVIVILIIQLLNRKYHILEQLFMYTRKHTIVAILYTTFFILFSIIHFVGQDFYQPLYIFTSLSLIFYQLFGITCIIAIMFNIKRENMVIYYIQKYTEQKQSYKEIEEFKHDYLNLLLSLKYLVEIKDWENSLAFLNDLEKRSSNFIHSSLSKQLEFISSPIIRGVFTSFISKAQGANLEVQVSLTQPIQVPTDSTFDIARVLTIILNNSIEHYDNGSTSSAPIIVKIETNNEGIAFHISNPINTDIDLTKIFQRKQSRKKDGGLGLFNLKKICNSYENIHYHIDVNKIDSRFIFSLSITKK